MTCLAWDGRTLAADGRMTEGNTITTDCAQKLFRLQKVTYFYDELYYFAMAGRVSHIEQLLDALHSKDFHEMEEDEGLEITGIIIGRDYGYYLEYESFSLVRVDRNTPMVWGSGGPYAASAMKFGLDARAAVKHAMRFDTCTGGRIRTVKL